MERAMFFAGIRAPLFGGSISPTQFQRLECLLEAIEDAKWPLPWAAYALATAHHETAKWQHLKELGGQSYFTRMYDKTGDRPNVAKALGNTDAGDGALFAGRGFVQLTGRANYRKAGAAIGVDLLGSPDKAMEPPIAARILIWGMSTGAYTGKKNADYLDKTPPNYTGARRIINGTDRAAMIAGYAETFAKALTDAGYGATAIEPVPALIEELPTVQPGILARFFSAFFRRLKGAA